MKKNGAPEELPVREEGALIGHNSGLLEQEQECGTPSTRGLPTGRTDLAHKLIFAPHAAALVDLADEHIFAPHAAALVDLADELIFAPHAAALVDLADELIFAPHAAALVDLADEHT
jgi:hypothetical protein